MKSIILSLGLMVGSTSSLKLEGIDKGALMQNNPSHWRKSWPEGDTDDGNGDAEVMDMFMLKKHASPKPKITYPWNYDEDVVETKKSLETAEGLTGSKLAADAVKDGGLGMIFTYDNTKVQNRRGYVHGPHEWSKLLDSEADYKLQQSLVPLTEMPPDTGFKYDD